MGCEIIPMVIVIGVIIFLLYRFAIAIQEKDKRDVQDIRVIESKQKFNGDEYVKNLISNIIEQHTNSYRKYLFTVVLKFENFSKYVSWMPAFALISFKFLYTDKNELHPSNSNYRNILCEDEPHFKLYNLNEKISIANDKAKAGIDFDRSIIPKYFVFHIFSGGDDSPNHNGTHVGGVDFIFEDIDLQEGVFNNG